MAAFYSYKSTRLALKLGFSLSTKCFGYGLVIPHYGTIVIGNTNRIGNYCVLHTSTCVVSRASEIGDGFYLSTGAKVSTHVHLGDNVSVAANSVVNKDFGSNILLAGMPAKIKKESTAWYERDGEIFADRVSRVEELKKIHLSEEKSLV